MTDLRYRVRVEKSYNAGDDFVVLRVLAPPLPEKRVAISVQSILDGRILVKDEIERQREDAKRRLQIHEEVLEKL